MAEGDNRSPNQQVPNVEQDGTTSWKPAKELPIPLGNIGSDRRSRAAIMSASPRETEISSIEEVHAWRASRSSIAANGMPSLSHAFGEESTMESTGLEFYTTVELIKELMRRQTFLGVVVHSQEELKATGWGEQRTFKVHFNANLDVLQTGRLLESVAQYIDRHYPPDVL